MKKIPLSIWLIAIISAILIFFGFKNPITNALSWDVFGYYLYLPAQFIYHDLGLRDQTWLKELIEKYNATSTLYQATAIDNGNWVMKYTLGLALLYAPFFGLAQLIASATGATADGLSAPYQYSLVAGGMLYAVLGLIIFRKALKSFFNERTTCILLILIVFGTNYFQLTTDAPLMSQNFLFTGYAALLWLTILWHKKPQLLSAIGIGLVCGIMILIRPSEIVCVLIPLLWNVGSRAALREKWLLFRRHWIQLIVCGACIIIPGTAQMLYWKMITGHYLYYSYNNPGEGFEFLSPYTMKFLFSFRKGWLIYTPLMLFAIIGLKNFYRHKRDLFPMLFLVTALSLYIISSWSCWWYAGASFSSRSMVPLYVLLALPLGYYIEDLAQRKHMRIISSIIILSMLILNLFQTWQFEKGILPGEGVTKSYYMAIFGKTEVKSEDRSLLMVERSKEWVETFRDSTGYVGRELCCFTFEDTKDSIQPAYSGIGSFRMCDTIQYSPGPDIPYKDLTTADHVWLRAGVWIYIPKEYNEPLPLLVITFHHDGAPYKYFTAEINKDKLKRDDWNFVTADYMTPEVRSEQDNLKVYVWHRGKAEIFVDNLWVKCYRPI